jgi:hypothetical protein
LIGGDIPGQCQGQPWQKEHENTLRIVERIHPRYYNISVEEDNLKAIYTYESNNPNCPTNKKIAEGPLHSEYYDLQEVRIGKSEDIREKLSRQTKDKFRTWAEEFMSDSRTGDRENSLDQDLDQETRNQLRNLGYR